MKMAITTLLISFGLYTHAANIDDVAFLSGCWSGQDGDITTSEAWSKASTNLMQAIVQMRNSKNEVVEYEFLRIEKMSDGSLVFTPYINGQQVSPFLFDSALSQDPNADKAVFINAQNDFPRTISYSRPKSDNSTLNIRLDGVNEKNEPLVIEFPLFKISCDKVL